jgi:hypothetical protein
VCVSAQSENCYLLTRDFSDCGACSVGFCPSCGQSVSNVDGSTIGGYLMSGQVFTTLELVLGTIDGVDFDREHDPRTGYQELVGSLFVMKNVESKPRAPWTENQRIDQEIIESTI